MILKKTPAPANGRGWRQCVKEASQSQKMLAPFRFRVLSNPNACSDLLRKNREMNVELPRSSRHDPTKWS